MNRTQPSTRKLALRHVCRSRAIALVACGLVVAGGAASISSRGTAKAAGDVRAAKHGFEQTLTGMRGKRYCELILIKRSAAPGALVAQVWNSYPFGSCPQAQWLALDLNRIAAQTGAIRALRNGPRYWLMSGVEKFASARPVTRRFGAIEMGFAATVKLGDFISSAKPYQQHQVSRNTIFRFAARSRVYELTAADGSLYVMQSWSQQTDLNLRGAGLAHLAARLHLPHGWKYHVRTLTHALQINTTTQPAIVLQDDLGDSYSLAHRGSSHR